MAEVDSGSRDRRRPAAAGPPPQTAGGDRPSRPAAPPADGSGPRAATSARIEQWLNITATVIAPTTAVTALLFYFGYVAVRAQYAYFGVDIDMLGLSTRDFVLRSPSALFLPVGSALLLALVLLSVRSHFLSPSPRRCPAGVVRRAAWVATTLGTAVFCRGLAGVAVPRISRTEAIATTPASLACGLVLVAVGRALFAHARPGPPATRQERRTRRLQVGCTAGFVTLMLFWTSTSVAAAYGRGRAVSLAGRLDSRPTVVLDTRERLWVTFDGVDEGSLPASRGQTYHYRYRGFRLLIQSGDRMFLVPARWPGTTVPAGTVMVHLDDSVRVQLLP